MDERPPRAGGEGRAEEEELSRTELQIEQEKLKLERERILLERARLEALRERVQAESGLRVGEDGRPSVALSTLTLTSIICLLLGGILGAFSSSVQRDRRSAARLQEVMDRLATAAPDGLETNAHALAGGEMPDWLKTMKPKGAHTGISLVVIQ